MMSRWMYLCVAFCIVLLPSLLPASDAAKKSPLPNPAAIKDATALVNDTFNELLAAAKTPELRTAATKKLLDAAAEEKDPASRFALLVKARDFASAGADFDSAAAAIDAMDRAFDLDALKMKTDAAVAVARSARTAGDRKKLAQQLDSVIDAAVTADRYDLAKSLADIALTAARAANDADLMRKTTLDLQHVREAETASADLKKLQQILADKPTDPEANLKVGKYHCFIKENWEKGLPMLALGSDTALKSLAETELAGVKDPEAQVKLADAWWDAAEKMGNSAKASAQGRAAKWYNAALPRLSGLARARVEKHLAQLAAAASSPTAHTTHKPLDTVIGLHFVEIPAGMLAKGQGKDAKKLEIKGFYMATTVVTQKQWQTVMGSAPWKNSSHVGDNHPAVYISWNNAVEFCKKLSVKSGKTFRLPTEAEWEYACRAGTDTKYFWGDDPAAAGDYAWITSNSGRKLQDVAKKKPNPWGLFDMLGNVSQLCDDVANPADGSRVIRGGDYSMKDAATLLVRNWGIRPDESSSEFTGLRVCMDSE